MDYVIHSFLQQIFTEHDVPDSILGLEDTSVNKTVKTLAALYANVEHRQDKISKYNKIYSIPVRISSRKKKYRKKHLIYDNKSTSLVA